METCYVFRLFIFTLETVQCVESFPSVQLKIGPVDQKMSPKPPSTSAMGSKWVKFQFCFNGLPTYCLITKSSAHAVAVSTLGFEHTKFQLASSPHTVVLVCSQSGCCLTCLCLVIGWSPALVRTRGSFGPVTLKPHCQLLKLSCLKPLKQIRCETHSCSFLNWCIIRIKESDESFATSCVWWTQEHFEVSQRCFNNL